tara:strand:- start:626 stop:1159 length:534 start_codon:yes stop_codon:yes gene_type:complete
MDLLNYFIVNETMTKDGLISLFGYENMKKLFKCMLIELLNFLFKLVESDGDEIYNGYVGYFINNFIIEEVKKEHEINTISLDEINTVRNILSSLRNKNRKDHHENLDDDSKKAKEAYRAIGLGVEFNEMHDFKDTINIGDIISDYLEESGNEQLDLGERVGISDFVPGEDDNDELDY